MCAQEDGCCQLNIAWKPGASLSFSCYTTWPFHFPNDHVLPYRSYGVRCTTFIARQLLILDERGRNSFTQPYVIYIFFFILCACQGKAYFRLCHPR